MADGDPKVGDKPKPPSVDAVYQGIRADIRATDEISFKLMGLVPLVSGAAFLTFIFDNQLTAKPRIVICLSVFAAWISLGLLRWELRNIQRCKWLQRRAELIEKRLPGGESKLGGAPGGIGKTEAEQFVYGVTILAWLLVPAVVCAWNAAPWWVWTLYAVAAVVTGIATLYSALRPVKPSSDDEIPPPPDPAAPPRAGSGV